MSVEDAVRLLRIVEQSFHTAPRNAYEVENRYLSNVERLEQARGLLTQFSGARIDELTKRVHEMASQNEQEKEVSAGKVPGAVAAPVSSAAATGAFSLDFDEDDGEGDAGDELAEAGEVIAKQAKKNKEKKAKKDEKKKLSKGKEGKGSKRKKENGEDDAEAAGGGTGSAIAVPSMFPESTDADGADRKNDSTPPVEPISTERDCTTDRVPLEVLDTNGKCYPVEGTALATVDFKDARVDWDGVECYCRVQLYRSVLLTLTSRPPTSVTAAPQRSAGASTGYVWDDKAEGEWFGSREGPAEDDDAAEDVPTTENAEEDAIDDSAEALQKLSQELVSEFDAAQAEKDEADMRTGFPTDFPSRLTADLRNATFEPWVVLMCMGGYFAGGIFVNGRCIRHRSFQRYVVRKKQGGRQSTNAKDGGGSYGSIGSQIRAAQEAKWKLEVRDILLEWERPIHDAAFILYVAPGPQNKSMLTDFSVLPPTAGGKRPESPIRADDPRVRKAPLTTHRPTFAEVQRIYETVSKVSVLYIPVEEPAASSA